MKLHLKLLSIALGLTIITGCSNTNPIDTSVETIVKVKSSDFYQQVCLNLLVLFQELYPMEQLLIAIK